MLKLPKSTEAFGNVRLVWQKEDGPNRGQSKAEDAIAGEVRNLRLRFHLCPGDTLVGTAAVESLHLQYPGMYRTDVTGTATDAIFANNPHITPLEEAEEIRMDYPLVNHCNQRAVHFMQGQVDTLAQRLGIKLDLVVNRPQIYLTNEERGWMSQVGDMGYKGKFWLVCSGIKNDYTVKGWGHRNYQAVVDALRGEVQFVQVGESHHNHKPLEGAINLVGQTDQRQLLRLAWNAEGGIGGVSYLHHVFAAYEKPFVCIASGMEPASWERYNTEVYLTMQGKLECCRFGGCWKSRTVPLNDNDMKDKSLCVLPVMGTEPVPKCMAMIKPEDVVAAIRSYYVGGILRH